MDVSQHTESLALWNWGSNVQSAEILLVESVGAFYFGAGTPQVVCRFEAVPPFRSARDQDRRISLPECSGFQGEFDTGAMLRHVFLRVRCDAVIHSYDINMHNSGFDGDGTGPVKALCRELFALAGYADYNRWIYGSE